MKNMHVQTKSLGSVKQVVDDFFQISKIRLSGMVSLTVLLGFISSGSYDIPLLLKTLFLVSGVVLGGCILNCFMEKDVDASMERTKNRPLPSGRMNPHTALMLGATLIVICLPLLYVETNPLTAFLCALAAILYLLAYTPMKKMSHWALYVGAIPGALPPLMGWTAATGEVSGKGVFLFLLLFFWQIPHFLAISLRYKKDYGDAGIQILANDEGVASVRKNILFSTIALIGMSLMPSLFAWKGYVYMTLSLALGLGFLASAILNIFYTNARKIEESGRQIFIASIIYLPLQLLVWVFF